MSRTLYVGDIFGDTNIIGKIDKVAYDNNVSYIIQVGNMGLGQPNSSIKKYFNKRQRQGKYSATWMVSSGYGDSAKYLDTLDMSSGECEIAPSLFHIGNGVIKNINGKKHLFVGGGESLYDFAIDKSLDLVHDADIIISYDCPLAAYCAVHISPSDNAHALNEIKSKAVSIGRPIKWFYGRHGFTYSHCHKNISFDCCGSRGEYILEKSNA